MRALSFVEFMLLLILFNTCGTASDSGLERLERKIEERCEVK
jgi:hypothetical protein